ncbi:MAG: flavin reductase family protein [Gordonia sp. (in: high G+C Gram-positive bacteria)]|uniref:flavin reductase family protein n=1 Tax=Gordonia sp. (in: high G+C Gram-positive bacteria) TaxID=84139 RepID=UPI0039E2A3A0
MTTTTDSVAHVAPDTVQLDRDVLRRAFAHVPTGLVTIAALADGAPVGLLSSTFTSVSLAPALVSVNIGVESTTLPALREQSHWGISVLADDQEPVTTSFRRHSAERFDDVAWTADPTGAVHLDGAAATFTTALRELIPAGDHVIALLEVHDHTTDPDAAPLVFHHSRLRFLEGAVR